MSGENEVELYLDFSGWGRLSPETRMQYFGEDESKPQFITVLEWCKLSNDEQGLYCLEDVIAAIRDSEELEYTELSIKKSDEN